MSDISALLFHFRDYGPISFESYNDRLTSNITSAERLVMQSVFEKLKKLFNDKHCMDAVPLELEEKFIKLATYLIKDKVIFL
jgi:hypothetical protein